jgi:hypothetical protein
MERGSAGLTDEPGLTDGPGFNTNEQMKGVKGGSAGLTEGPGLTDDQARQMEQMSGWRER